MANFNIEDKVVSVSIKDNTVQVIDKPKLAQRDEVLSGKTYKTKIPDKDSMYITINNDSNNKPFEIFINSRNTEHYQWQAALTRVMSAVFRTSDDTSFLVKELKAVVDPNGGFWKKGKYVPSIVAEIGNVLERHMMQDKQPEVINTIEPKKGSKCPECGEYAVIKVDGCTKCTACTYIGSCG